MTDQEFSDLLVVLRVHLVGKHLSQAQADRLKEEIDDASMTFQGAPIIWDPNPETAKRKGAQ